MYVCCVHNKFNKCDPQKNSRIVIFAAATPTPHQIGRGAGEGLFLLKAFTLRRCIKWKFGFSTKSINLYLPWIVDGDEDKRKIIGWRWATWFDPPIKYIQTSDPRHPITVGSILSAALVEQDDNASFVDTDRLLSLPNDCAWFKMNHQSDHAWSCTLIRRTSCCRQATFFKSCRKKINFFEGGMRKHILLLSVWLQKISLDCVPKTLFFALVFVFTSVFVPQNFRI